MAGDSSQPASSSSRRSSSISNPNTNSNSSDNCPACKSTVSTSGVECGLCASWFHLKCLKLTGKQAVNSAHVVVLCSPCLKSFHNFKSGKSETPPALIRELEHVQNATLQTADKIGALETQVNSATELANDNNQRLTDIDRKLDEFRNSFQSILPNTGSLVNSGNINNFRRPVPGSINGLLPPGQNSSYASVASRNVINNSSIVTVGLYREMQQEDITRRSGVIKGLPENGNDLETVNNICAELDNSVTVLEVFRMGAKPRATADKPNPPPRLLKVHFKSSSCLRSILREAKSLKDSANWSNIYIRRSMTAPERQRLSYLYNKRDELNEARDQDALEKYVVMNDRLVRFTNCTKTPDGKFINGTRDRHFQFSVPDENQGET